jgi:hypothetical protein
MPLHSVPRRPPTPQVDKPLPSPINWRRGVFRVWVLVTAAWIMSWAIYYILFALEGGFSASNLLAIPVLLFGPPIALLIFGVATGWAFRGFRIEPRPEDE